MHIVLDAPRWRIAGQPPIVHPVKDITIVDGDLITVNGGSVYYSAREYEISFVPSSWIGYAIKRQYDAMQRC